MTLSIDVIDIKNNMHQLNALPIEESVFVLFSSKPDANQIKKYVHLFRIDSESTWPSVGDPNYSQILYSKEKFGSVDYDFTIMQDGDKFILELDPKEVLYTNSKYVLFVEKGLTPEYYNYSKVVTRGNSAAYIETVKDSISLTETAKYEIVITQSSTLGLGTHTIRFNVLKNDVQIFTDVALDILKNNRYFFNDKTSIVFETKYPFIAPERFICEVVPAVRLERNRIQEITTHVDAEVIKTEDNQSSRIQYEDILEFYKDNVFVQQPEPSNSSTAIGTKAKYTNIHKFIVYFDQSISDLTITPDSFDIDFSEAFGNYMLPKFGKYDPANKYIVTYRILDSTSIEFSVVKDTTNTVPVDKKYIVVEA